nr:hypothetical protein [Carrot chordovirus 3]
MTFYSSSNNRSDVDKMNELHTDLLKQINKSLIEVRDLLKESVKERKVVDNSLSNLKDKDLLKLEAGALYNNNKAILGLVREEYDRRGLFIEGDQIVPVKREVKR